MINKRQKELQAIKDDLIKKAKELEELRSVEIAAIAASSKKVVGESKMATINEESVDFTESEISERDSAKNMVEAKQKEEPI